MFSDAFLNQIKSTFTPSHYSQDPHQIEKYGKDWTRFHQVQSPLVFFPNNAQELSQILKLCSQFKVPVVPSGGRTGLAAGAVACKGEVVVSLERLRSLSQVDSVSMTLRAGAGITTEEVHIKAAEAGLTWPIDLAAKGSSTVGGNISTNAGGVRVIRYGHTRNWVQSLELVLMNGDILELSGNLEKNNTGYDLRQLVIGAEGTLGIVTAATLKLVPLVQNKSTLFFGFENLEKVLLLLSELRTSGFVPMAFELLTSECMQAVCDQMKKVRPFESDHKFYCLLEIEAPHDESLLIAWLEKLMNQKIVGDGTLAQSPSEAKALWAYRENITESLSQMGRVYKNDISVPISNIDTFMNDLWKNFHDWYPGCNAFLFGHVGDGNIHVNVLKGAGQDEKSFLQMCEKRNHDLFKLLKKFGGSIAAEHGIGLLKKEYLGYCRSPQEIEIFRGIKKVFDPEGLLNPGKIFD